MNHPLFIGLVGSIVLITSGEAMSDPPSPYCSEVIDEPLGYFAF